MAFTLPADLPVDWVDNIGMVEDADFLNKVGAMDNALKAALLAIVNGAAVTTVATSETTTSGTYTDLTTTADSVTVTIGASGKALVIFSAETSVSAGSSRMSYAMSGANTAPATDAKSATFHAQVGAAQDGTLIRAYMETGLTPGSTTFKPKFRSAIDTSTKTFLNRQIIAIPFP